MSETRDKIKALVAYGSTLAGYEKGEARYSAIASSKHLAKPAIKRPAQRSNSR